MAIQIRRFKDGLELNAAMAKRIAGELLRMDSHPTGLMLSGGETPKPVFNALAAAPASAAPGVHVLYTDERHVAQDAPESNYNTSLPLLQAWHVPDARVLRVETENGLEAAARGYHEALDKFLAGSGRIALGLLGLGTDGHTCSLFTDEDLARSAGEWACAVPKPSPPDRISVTPALLARVEHIVFWVAGAGKREVATQLAEAPETLVAGRAVADCANVELWTDSM